MPVVRPLTMNKKTICKSAVELMEIHQLDDGELYILEIVDFGHNMASDFRIIPKNQIQKIMANFNDKRFCEELSKNRTKYKPFSWAK